MNKLAIILIPLDFLDGIRALSWSIAIGGIFWIILRRVCNFQQLPRITVGIWVTIELMGFVAALTLLAWYFGFDKSEQGLPFIAAIFSGLPFLIPAAVGLLVRPHSVARAHRKDRQIS